MSQRCLLSRDMCHKGVCCQGTYVTKVEDNHLVINQRLFIGISTVQYGVCVCVQTPHRAHVCVCCLRVQHTYQPGSSFPVWKKKKLHFTALLEDCQSRLQRITYKSWPMTPNPILLSVERGSKLCCWVTSSSFLSSGVRPRGCGGDVIMATAVWWCHNGYSCVVMSL